MKPYVFILLLAYSISSFSQIQPKKNKKVEEFNFYAKPDATNKLSKFFRNRIDLSLLNDYRFSETEEAKNHVYLSFAIDEKRKIVNTNVSSNNFKLNESITKAFKEYNIVDLNLPEKNSLNKYVLQILSKEGDKMIVNCSSVIIFDQFPVFEGCESGSTFDEMYECLHKQLEQHIVNSISKAEIKNSKALGTLDLFVRFFINKTGDIEQINCKGPTENLTLELNRIVALFPKAKIPPYRNNMPTTQYYQKTIKLLIETNDEKYEEEALKAKDSNLNPNSELALHFKKFISEKELESIKVYKPIKISFSVDKKGKLEDFSANSNDEAFNKNLIKIFKTFPIEKLNIKSSSVLDEFNFTIITNFFSKNEIGTNENPNVSVHPFFDKKSENAKSPMELKDQLKDKIINVIITEFDPNIISRFNLVNNIVCVFQIDTDGSVKIVTVNSSDLIIGDEIKRIIKNLKLYRPAYLNGKAIKFVYTLSLRFEDFAGKLTPNTYIKP